MNKQTIITILLILVAMAGQAQVRCHVIGTVAEGTTPIELRIYRDGEDPKNSTLRPELKDGCFECDVERAVAHRGLRRGDGEGNDPPHRRVLHGGQRNRDHPARRR